MNKKPKITLNTIIIGKDKNKELLCFIKLIIAIQINDIIASIIHLK